MAVYCAQCKAPKTSVAGPCDVCGSELFTHNVQLEGLAMKVSGGNIGFVLDQRPDGGREIKVQTPAGATSSSSVRGDNWSHTVRRPAMGRRGDARVVHDLANVLDANGCAIVQLEARDGQGEDGKLRIASDEYTVQVVSVPLNQELWNDASKHSGKLEHTPEQGVGALRESIALKCERTPPGERKRTIVALDGVHAGTLVDCVDGYLQTFGDPTGEYGIASVWFVGPNELLVKRIGGGAP